MGDKIYLGSSANLIFREFYKGDQQFIYKLLNSKNWLDYIGDRDIKTLNDADQYIQQHMISSYDQRGYGPWLILLKNSLIPIGMCGLFKREELDLPDLGFAFLPEYEGFGHARESAVAILQHIKKKYPFKGLYAITTPPNTKSQRLLKKIGFEQLDKYETSNSSFLKFWLKF